MLLSRLFMELSYRRGWDDRRANPSWGNRAVHVIATVNGKPVEIQVRTKLQDLWAQAMEKLADVWGRGIRYGEAPEEPERDAFTLLTGAATVGLWRRRRWGRSLALVIALGNIGLGTLALLAVILSRTGDMIGPSVLLVVSLILAYVLSRRVFNFPDE